MTILLLLHQRRNKIITPESRGITIIEVAVGILVLGIAGSMAIQLTNSTTKAMNGMDGQSKVDSAITTHLEKIRDAAFSHLCTTGCEDGESDLKLTYNENILNQLCDGGEGNGLANHFLEELSNTGLNPSSINVQDYDPTAASIPISLTITEDPNNSNLLNITFEASEQNKKVITTVMPNAQKWCP